MILHARVIWSSENESEKGAIWISTIAISKDPVVGKQKRKMDLEQNNHVIAKTKKNCPEIHAIDEKT